MATNPFKLTGVEVTTKELGRGGFAKVLELNYLGLKCAGKQIYDAIVTGSDGYITNRFEKECKLLSELHHPNIVQCLGIYSQEGYSIPILVMEYCPLNLTSCIDKYDIIPDEISYSILCDVALGLSYLHHHSPPIVHRDLSSNNVLLTHDMTAKISDLGLAKILNINPQESIRLSISTFISSTRGCGTIVYMPPEVMVEKPKYETTIDIFSFGILMIHMLCGKWPQPQMPQLLFEGGKEKRYTEAERRDVFLRDIPSDHPLMQLIKNCIANDPKERESILDVVKQLQLLVKRTQPQFLNRLEMLRRIQTDEEEKKGYEEEIKKLRTELHTLTAKCDDAQINDDLKVW